MDSHEITEKINPNEGANVVFIESSSNKECVTMQRSEHGLCVGARVTTFIGALDAEHFYATLSVSPLMYRYTNESTGCKTSTCQPEPSKGIRINVCGTAKHNIYSKYVGEKHLEISKGMPTSRFESVEDAIEAIEAEFNRIFGDPWTLKHWCADETWEEYKKELLEDYGSKK